MGPEGRRRLELRKLSNAGLFELYDSELVLHLHAAKNLADTRKILASLQQRLGDRPPSIDLAKSFLAQYANRQPRTLYRYTQMVKAFMKWYGEPILDLKIKIPKSIPQYNDDATVDKVREAIGQKKTHKKCIARDELLFDFDRQSGLRRAELGNLLVKHVHAEFVEVRKGKGNKDRIIPLTSSMAVRLHNFIEQNHLKPEDKLFGMTPASIGNKIRQFADRAGVPELHAHSLRHKFATDLLEGGTNIRVVQDLLGHENLNTTQVYLSINNKAREEAIRGLEGHPLQTVRDSNPERNHTENEATDRRLQERHQKNMLKIIERWRKELRISCADMPIKDLFSRETLTDPKTGMHNFSKSKPVGFQSFSLNWQVRDEGIIDLCFPLELETDIETRILRDYLFDHVRSSQCSWVLTALDRGMMKWKELGGQELKERNLLYNNIESKVEKITSVKVIDDDFIQADRPGPTKWLAESIYAALNDEIYTNLPYYPVEALEFSADNGSQIKLFKAKYGARCIGYAITKEGAAQYQEWHREIMMGFQSGMISKIKQLIIDREKVIQEVDEALARTLVDGQVPGKCSGCPTHRL